MKEGSKRVENMKQLRESVIDALAMLKENPEMVQQAHETANLSGKVIRMCALQLEVAKLNSEKIGGEWHRFITDCSD